MTIVSAALLLLTAHARAQTAPQQTSSVARAVAEAQELYEQKRYAEAEARFTSAIAESEKTAQAPAVLGGCLILLSATQNKEGKYLVAEQPARQAVAIFEQLPISEGMFPLSTALAMLSDALEGQGKYSDAAAIVERQWVLEGKDDSDPTYEYRGIPFRRHLGRLYRENKEYDRAVALLQKNVTLLERPRLNVPTSVVPALNDLAEAYMAQGKVAEADASLHRALTLIDAHPEQIDDPLLLTTLDDYAGLLKRMGRFAEAEKLATRANAVRAQNSDSVTAPEPL